MRHFSLFLDVKGDWVLVSTSDAFHNPFSCYDENLNEGEHSQYTLSFSVLTKNIVNEIEDMNPLLSYYFLGAKMYLILDNNKRIDLIISKVAPDSNELSTMLSIEAQDEVSYKWSKRNLGMSYSTTAANSDLLVPKHIFDIAKDVLRLSFLDKQWSITSQSLDAALETQPFTLEVTDSNPYNILIEACNTINAYMSVDYNKKRLDFFRKDLVREFSGYRYTPSVNIIDYGVDYSGEEMTTILHVSGGEDAQGNLVTMIPSMPNAIRSVFYWFGQTEQDIDWDKVFAIWPSWENMGDIINNSPWSWHIEKSEQVIASYPRPEITMLKKPLITFVHFTLGEKSYSLHLEYVKSSEVFEGFTLNGEYFNAQRGGYLIPLSEAEGELFVPLEFTGTNLENYEYEDKSIYFLLESNNAFVPIYKFNKDNIEQVIGIEYMYYVKYDDIEGKYYGHIYNSERDIEYRILLNEKDTRPFGIESTETQDANFNIIRTKTTQNEDIILYQELSEINKFKQEYANKQQKEIDDFLSIANKIPYLGQSIFDFSPFLPYMSDNEKTSLDSLINTDMRKANIKLQYYATEYYHAVYELNSLRKKFIAYAQEYGAACNKYQELIKAGQDEEQETIETKQEIERTVQQLYSVINNSNYIKLVGLLGKDNLLCTNSYEQYFENLIQEQKKKIEEYQQYRIGIVAFESDSFLTNERQSEIEYYTDLINTASQLCYGFDYDSGVENRGVYQLIVDYLSKFVNIPIREGGVASKFIQAQNDLNNRILPQLYYKFGQYIYEQNYENADELSSVSLYNQAITHFADINRPQSNHSLEVLDIGELEQINIPRLSIGSMIQVYNKDSINAQPYLYILRQIEKYSALEQNAHAANDAVNYNNYTTQRTIFEEKLKDEYKKNHSLSEISLSELYNKIYYDSIFVTGINRVLREPLKDSVTVAQPSRYKTILSKLIKSI